MGCDIHFIKEKKINGVWTGVYYSDEAIGDRPKVSQRSYPFFTELAGVRGESKTSHEPRGIPDDASASTNLIYAEDGDHTPSWLSAKEFVEAYDRAYTNNPMWLKWYRPENLLYDILSIWGDEGEDYRIVFWFDN